MTDLEVKRRVRDRDGHACTKCGMSATGHRVKYGCDLDVHRTVPGSEYTVDGCVTLCRGCHGPEPKRPRKTYPNGTKVVQLKTEWLPVLSKLAGKRTQPLLWYLMSLADADAKANGLEIPNLPWNRKSG